MDYLWFMGDRGFWDFPAMVDDTRGYITITIVITCAAARGEHTRMSGTCHVGQLVMAPLVVETRGNRG